MTDTNAHKVQSATFLAVGIHLEAVDVGSSQCYPILSVLVSLLTCLCFIFHAEYSSAAWGTAQLELLAVARWL